MLARRTSLAVALSALAVSAAPALAATSAVDDLRFMREEEKVAHDLYAALGERWGDPVFTTIAASEAVHQDAILALMRVRAIADTSPPQPGRFADPALQRLYDALLARGLRSREEALRVGVAVERRDIADLAVRIRRASDSGVARVYLRLKAASGNHLRAFTRRLGA